ncbi:MAG: OmpH family outer membrane protein [Chlamydiales bacterium]|nr:OmpH family outer membrane protein [Chlamydiales bacterium]
MKIKQIRYILLGLAISSSSLGYSAIAKQDTAIVDFASCVQESKYGKREQESFESLRKQLHAILDDAEKQLNDVASKLQDQDYIDSLSPNGEQELRMKFQALSEELNRYQSQYYQILQQANMRIIQSIAMQINHASEAVAKNKKIPIVINKEAAFYYDPTLDITKSVISQMDKDFEIAEKEGKLPNTNVMMGDPKQLLQGGVMNHG